MSRQLANYDRVAGVYDLLSGAWSLGKIRAAKLDQINWLEPDQAVLFAGCGSGAEVEAAARHGCHVTAVDTSKKMLEQLQRRLDRAGCEGRLIHDRVENLPVEPLYDVACANFFLNCFPAPRMRELLEQIAAKVRPGGRLMIADVAPPDGNVLARLLNRAYLRSARFPFWVTGLVHWHADHDYIQTLGELGWSVDAVRTFRVPPPGPVMYRNLVATRREAG